MSAIEDLVTELARLPTIGRKSALRLTYHLLKQPPEQSKRLASALTVVAERVRKCERCNNLTEDMRCAICMDPRRDQGMICAVEEAGDIAAIERTGEFRGCSTCWAVACRRSTGWGQRIWRLNRLSRESGRAGCVR